MKDTSCKIAMPIAAGTRSGVRNTILQMTYKNRFMTGEGYAFE